MSKAVKSKNLSGKKVRQYTPVVVYMWAIGLGFMSYAVARVALDAFPHPVHWLSGLVGAVMGYFIGWLWYRWRGDVI
jgi:hypothetical protein